MRCILLVFWIVVISGRNLVADVASERVEFKQGEKQQLVLGNILVEAEDGGVLLEGRNQTVWPLQPDEIISRQPLDEPPEPLSESQLAESVMRELPGGFRVYKTNHYVICYNTSKSYAEWCGALFERLHRAFNNYWSRRGIQLHDTPPLVACVFRDKKSYELYGKAELGTAIQSMLGYYSYRTNRIAMYDLLETRRTRSVAQVNQLLRRERTVATVIHEATHQLAFNSGLHQRFADIPLWLSEGLAIFFETPDLTSTRGWTTIGEVNRVRLGRFEKYFRHRNRDSLLTLTSTDDRFQTKGLATDAYAESWAFCYYLIRNHEDEFVDYLKRLQAKQPLDVNTPQQRIEDFTLAFGKSPLELERNFVRQMRRIR